MSAKLCTHARPRQRFGGSSTYLFARKPLFGIMPQKPGALLAPVFLYAAYSSVAFVYGQTLFNSSR